MSDSDKTRMEWRAWAMEQAVNLLSSKANLNMYDLQDLYTFANSIYMWVTMPEQLEQEPPRPEDVLEQKAPKPAPAKPHMVD